MRFAAVPSATTARRRAAAERCWHLGALGKSLSTSRPQHLDAADLPTKSSHERNMSVTSCHTSAWGPRNVMKAQASATVIDDIIITSELSQRARRTPDYVTENRALVKLAGAMAQSPDEVLQMLADCALELCRAGSAGISVLENADNTVLRWRATAGVFAPYAGFTLPRDFSPCGVVLDRQSPLLMSEPARFFPYIAELNIPVHEALLVPFARDGVLVGTVWVAAHEDGRRFDAEDERILTSLTSFAQAAFLILDRMEEAERAERLRRKHEEDFRAFVTATSDVVYRMSPDWSEMHPLDGRGLVASNSEPIQNWLSHSLPASEQERVRAAIERAVTETAVFELEHQIIRPDGSLAWIFSRAIPIVDASEAISEWLGTATNVTERKKAEQLLLEQERQALERAVVAEQLVGIVSHDLRTPLQVISLGANVLASSPLNASDARIVNRIAAAAKRAGQLILDILDFTQARLGGGLRITPVELNLDEIVADIVEDLKVAAPGRMIEHRAQGTGPGIADPARIWQLVTNLVSNALTYGQPSAPVVITSRTTQNNLMIEVHNEGAPIPSDLQAQIFEPLRRGKQEVALGSRSVGLGLYIVQQIALAHGGEVAVTSTAQTGTTFAVSLPRLRPTVC